jgi:hypothetical protein
VLDARDFVPAGRWQSPPFLPGGFDTQFFLAELPDGEVARVEEGELQGGEWIAPADALARWKANRALLAAPALGSLRELSKNPDASPQEVGGRVEQGRPRRAAAACRASRSIRASCSSRCARPRLRPRRTRTAS